MDALRRWPVWTCVLILFVAIALFPLRLALALADVDRIGLTARDVGGSIWRGSMQDVSLAGASLGSLETALSPVQIWVGRIRFDVWRRSGQGEPLAGALTIGFGQRGIDDVSGALPVGSSMAPFPVGQIHLDDVTVHFFGRHCAVAEGQVRAVMSGEIAGLSLSRGMAGPVQCDTGDLLVPLVSQTGLERMTIRITGEGHYVARMVIRAGQGADGTALQAAGFTRIGEDFVLVREGQQ